MFKFLFASPLVLSPLEYQFLYEWMNELHFYILSLGQQAN